MTAWHDGRLCAFDCETTGVDYETDRIVTAAIAVVGGGQETETRTCLINPCVPIAEEATAVHGITNERAQAEGTPPAAAILAIVSALRAEVSRGRPIVAFNARFDLTMLDREARRYGLPPLADLRVIDPLVIDKWLHRYRRGSRKLDAVCAHYGVRLDNAHDAAADAVAAARVAWVLGKRARPVSRDYQPEMDRTWDAVRDDLDALHAAQIGWAAEQAESLAAYFAQKGEPQHVEPAWPVVPVPVTA